MDQNISEHLNRNNLDVRMEVTLNLRGCNMGDINSYVGDSFLDPYNVTVKVEVHPAAVGEHHTIIKFIVGAALRQIAAGVLQELGADIFKWVKNKLKKILKNKNNFDGSHVEFEFEDVTILIPTDSKEKIFEALNNSSEIINFYKKEMAEKDIVVSSLVEVTIEDFTRNNHAK